MSVYAAPTEIDAMVQNVIDEHHPELKAAGVTVLCQMHLSKSGLKLHGYPCLAIVRLIPPKDRSAGLPDARIVFDAAEWKTMSDETKLATVDHELYHLSPVGAWTKIDGEQRFVSKQDDAGRPKIKMRRHDWELGGFREIAERHGEHAPEVQGWKATADTFGQYLMPWDDSAPVPSTLAMAV